MRFFVILKVVIKSLLRKPATVRYPFAPRDYPAGTRGKVDIAIKDCIFCGLCQRKCPTGALTVDRAKKSWLVRRMQCISCGACVDACPKKCLSLNTRYSAPSTAKQEDLFQAE